METLDAYIRGHNQAVYEVFTYKKLHLAKHGSTYYFMKGLQVVDHYYWPQDKSYELAIKLENTKSAEGKEAVVKELKKEIAYKTFVRFVKDEFNEEFKL